MASKSTRTQTGGRVQRGNRHDQAEAPKKDAAAESKEAAEPQKVLTTAKAPGPASASRGSSTATQGTKKKPDEEDVVSENSEGPGETEEEGKKEDFWQDLVAHAWNSSRRRKEEEA